MTAHEVVHVLLVSFLIGMLLPEIADAWRELRAQRQEQRQ